MLWRVSRPPPEIVLVQHGRRNGSRTGRHTGRTDVPLTDLRGRTTADIRTERPGWTIWADGVPEGETADDVGARADRVLAELQERLGDGAAAVFAHGHLLRVLAARWLDLAPSDGRLLALDTATISVLGFERETKVIRLWNVGPTAEARQ